MEFKDRRVIFNLSKEQTAIVNIDAEQEEEKSTRNWGAAYTFQLEETNDEIKESTNRPKEHTDM